MHLHKFFTDPLFIGTRGTIVFIKNLMEQAPDLLTVRSSCEIVYEVNKGVACAAGVMHFVSTGFVPGMHRKKRDFYRIYSCG